MKILSHRGYWLERDERNSKAAFERSFSIGLGIETDVRDHNKCLVISHDMPQPDSMMLTELLSLADVGEGGKLTLALNIKSDGLAEYLKPVLDDFPNLDCFVFDMSVPDMRSYFDMRIPVFSRLSEVERSPVWLEYCDGVWLDSFESVWFDLKVIKQFLDNKKRVCVVSPELHGREHLMLWDMVKPLKDEPGLMLCTDFPEQATEYFLAF